jgi:Restriction endonuclease
VIEIKPRTILETPIEIENPWIEDRCIARAQVHPDEGRSMQKTQSESSEARVVTSHDVSLAQSASDKAESYLDEAESLLLSIASRQQELTQLLKSHERLRMIRQQLDARTTRGGGLILGIVISCAIVLVVCHVIGLPPAVTVISMLAALSSLIFLGIRLFKPNDLQMDTEITAWQRELRTLDIQEQETQTVISKAKSSYEQAYSNHELVLNAFQSRINRLRCTDWRALQSITFENFLAEVFREWGYHVETTKASGDQGVDLIITKNGVRTAVQAKGYMSSTVGNDAIQQAFTGMKFYNCQRCAVITNSTFTASARQAAAAVGCVLVDGAKLPLLIEGQFII